MDSWNVFNHLQWRPILPVQCFMEQNFFVRFPVAHGGRNWVLGQSVRSKLRPWANTEPLWWTALARFGGLFLL